MLSVQTRLSASEWNCKLFSSLMRLVCCIKLFRHNRQVRFECTATGPSQITCMGFVAESFSLPPSFFLLSIALDKTLRGIKRSSCSLACCFLLFLSVGFRVFPWGNRSPYAVLSLPYRLIKRVHPHKPRGGWWGVRARKSQCHQHETAVFLSVCVVVPKLCPTLWVCWK